MRNRARRIRGRPLNPGRLRKMQPPSTTRVLREPSSSTSLMPSLPGFRYCHCAAESLRATFATRFSSSASE